MLNDIAPVFTASVEAHFVRHMSKAKVSMCPFQEYLCILRRGLWAQCRGCMTSLPRRSVSNCLCVVAVLQRVDVRRSRWFADVVSYVQLSLW